MDETTRLMIAYATLLFGIPILAAKIVWFVPGTISAKVLAQIARRLDRFTDAAIEGFLSLLLACLVFEYLNLRVQWAVPVTLIIVNLTWNWINGESLYAWLSTAGIIAGFLLYPAVLPYLQTHIASYV